MNFIEEIRQMENDRYSKEGVVINDILDYFEKKMNNNEFKEILKNYIKEAINKAKNTCDLKIEFWEYHSGCSDTYIYVSGCGKFEIKGNNDSYDSKYNYKGVRLEEIHKRICKELSKMLKEKLEELGLKVLSSKREDDNYRFDYYIEKITIGW